MSEWVNVITKPEVAHSRAWRAARLLTDERRRPGERPDVGGRCRQARDCPRWGPARAPACPRRRVLLRPAATVAAFRDRVRLPGGEARRCEGESA